MNFLNQLSDKFLSTKDTDKNNKNYDHLLDDLESIMYSQDEKVL
jgi:hypothetical protein